MVVLFWIRKNKLNKNKGTASIYCRVSVNGKRIDFSIFISIKPSEWNNKRQCVANITYQKRLNDIKAQLDIIFYSIQSSGKIVTAKEVKLQYFEKEKPAKKEPVKHLMMLFNNFVDNQKPRVGFDLSTDSFRIIKTRRDNLLQFLIEENKIYLMPEEFTPSLANKFAAYFSYHKKFSQAYVNKNLQTIKQVLAFGYNENFLIRHPLQFYRLKAVESKEKTFLDVNEIEQIKVIPLIPVLDRIRNLFLFQIYTGMAYVEMKNFKASIINIDRDGRQWITSHRQKSAVKFDIPILPEVNEILNKYDRQLPLLTNQKYNEYLKLLGTACGIEKHLTTHVARRSCGYMFLHLGISLEVVSHYLGHKSIRTTEEIYAKIKRERMLRELIAAKLVA